MLTAKASTTQHPALNFTPKAQKSTSLSTYRSDTDGNLQKNRQEELAWATHFRRHCVMSKLDVQNYLEKYLPHTRIQQGHLPPNSRFRNVPAGVREEEMYEPLVGVAFYDLGIELQYLKGSFLE